MTLVSHSKKVEPRDQFKKVQRAEDAKKAMSEYEADAAAILAKTARLKALRLARDAAVEKVPSKATAEKTRKKPAKKGQDKEKSATLSEWLKDRNGAGWRS
jgi:hypothetical protein